MLYLHPAQHPPSTLPLALTPSHLYTSSVPPNPRHRPILQREHDAKELDPQKSRNKSSTVWRNSGRRRRLPQAASRWLLRTGDVLLPPISVLPAVDLLHGPNNTGGVPTLDSCSFPRVVPESMGRQLVSSWRTLSARTPVSSGAWNGALGKGARGSCTAAPQPQHLRELTRR